MIGFLDDVFIGEMFGGITPDSRDDGEAFVGSFEAPAVIAEDLNVVFAVAVELFFEGMNDLFDIVFHGMIAEKGYKKREFI